VQAIPNTEKISIIYADADILLINKPPNLLSVPGRALDNKDCVISRLHAEGWQDALIVHRLDFDTSGLLLLARNKNAHRTLSMQFAQRKITKTYLALVYGIPLQNCGTIDLPLRYDPPTKPRHVVDFTNGKPSLTNWQLLTQYDNYCRLKLQPITGRSHQLRVHLHSIGHPILGDTLYAHSQALNMRDRLCLHAFALEFEHPTNGKLLRFKLDAPF